jgi:hypothetical protein
MSPLRKLKGTFNKLIFRPHWYLANNPDVALSNMDPWLHYSIFGINEGRALWRQPSFIAGPILFIKNNGGIFRAMGKLICLVIKNGPLETVKKARYYLLATPSLRHSSDQEDYDNYIKATEPSIFDLDEMRRLSTKLDNRPLFSIVVPVFNVDAN